MWTRIYSKTFENVQRLDIWRIWTDVNHWAEWHGDLDYCRMEGAFTVGNHFILKPKNVRPVKIVLTEIKEGYQFTDCTVFLGAKMYDTHTLEETAEGLKLTNTLVVTGPLKWLWVKLVAQNVADTVAEETEALIKLVRQLHG
jgi:hypothetical protein